MSRRKNSRRRSIRGWVENIICVLLNQIKFIDCFFDRYPPICWIKKSFISTPTIPFVIISLLSSFNCHRNLQWSDTQCIICFGRSAKCSFTIMTNSPFTRHTIKVISSSLADLSSFFLLKLFHLCLNLRIYILDPISMPRSSTINSKSLFQFNQIISQILIGIHHQISSTGYSDSLIQLVNSGPLDFIINMTSPFVTNRWALEFDSSRLRTSRLNQRMQQMTMGNSICHSTTFSGNNSLDILYFPQEYLPLRTETSNTVSVDYLLGQLLTIESDLHNISSSFISFSLEQTYLNTSTILPTYYYKILLIRLGDNHYSHVFTFELNTTRLARNLSLIFADLPNSQKYTFTIDIAYNQSCLSSKPVYGNNERNTVYQDLWQYNYFVYSIPIRAASFVCGQVTVVSKDVPIRDVKRTGYFLVVETGCYSFQTQIYDDYASGVSIRCWLDRPVLVKS